MSCIKCFKKKLERRPPASKKYGATNIKPQPLKERPPTLSVLELGKPGPAIIHKRLEKDNTFQSIDSQASEYSVRTTGSEPWLSPEDDNYFYSAGTANPVSPPG